MMKKIVSSSEFKGILIFKIIVNTVFKVYVDEREPKVFSRISPQLAV